MSVFSFLGSRKKQPSAVAATPSRRKARPEIERLEDRQLLSCALISGFVYYDANNNGIFDTGETPLANSTVQLKNSAGQVVATTTSDSNGFYEFTVDQTVSTASTTQTQELRFDTNKTDWSATQALKQFDPSLGQLTGVDIINNGSLTSQIQFESLDQAPTMVVGTVSGTVTLTGAGLTSIATNLSASQSFNAAAFDGTIDFAGASGHDFGDKTATGSKTISLTNGSDLSAFTGTGTVSLTETAHATSSATGAGNLMTLINSKASADLVVVYHYIPSNCLKAGNYTIVQTSQPAGYIDGKDSQNGVIVPASAGTDIIPVTLTAPTTTTGDPQMTSTNNNFGEIKGASVGGFDYLDMNNDGIKDPTETGIAGVSILLSGANDLGQQVSLRSFTGFDGSYQFNNLRPGTYSITETQPAAYLDGKDTLGSLGGSITNNDQFQVTLKSGDSGVNYNFGELPPPVSVTGTPIVTEPTMTKRMFLASTFRL